MFQNRELQIMRKLEHQNIVKLKFFFYSSGDKVVFFTNPAFKIIWIITFCIWRSFWPRWNFELSIDLWVFRRTSCIWTWFWSTYQKRCTGLRGTIQSSARPYQCSISRFGYLPKILSFAYLKVRWRICQEMWFNKAHFCGTWVYFVLIYNTEKRSLVLVSQNFCFYVN